jgi:uncharacterized protein (TIGR03118 family)
VTFQFEWLPPATDQGSVTLYVAANAANGNGTNTGDRIYTTKLTLLPAVPVSGTGGAAAVPQTRFAVKKLVSDVAGMADTTDASLVNPWGIGLGASTAFWISNNKTGNTTVYNGAGQPFPLASPLNVTIPASGGVSAPTGQAANPYPGFAVAPGKPAAFIFVTEQGTISGWNRDVDAGNAVIMVDNGNSGAVYKGVALGLSAAGPRLFAANFAAGTVDTFDAAWTPVALAGGFVDPDLPAGYAPFNVARAGNSLLVSFAKQDDARQDDVSGPGSGYVSVFDFDGKFRRRLISGGPLNSPWGMTVAPSFFGDFSNALLVGNFGDGRVNAFDLLSGEYMGTLQDAGGNDLVLEGLWALQVGNGRNGGDSNTVYFTAGTSAGGRLEDHGLFGSFAMAPAN